MRCVPRAANAVEGPDTSGFGEGERYLGSDMPDATGRIELNLDGPLPNGFNFISATATSLADGSTSEFSAVCGYIDANDDGNPDTDGDSLCDDWETNGINYDGDDTVDLPLHMAPYHADPLHKDLFVEVDAFPGLGPVAEPNVANFPIDPRLTRTNTSLDRVIVAFYNSPVKNVLVGDLGINMHITVDALDQLAGNPNFPNSFADFDLVKAAHFGSPADQGNSAILGAKRLVFRYSIFVNTYGNDASSGLGELHGNDFIVALGGNFPAAAQTAAATWGTTTENERRDQQAATFMHELGHTLGLDHGGGDDINCKPNYLSIMRYRRQFNVAGVPALPRQPST